jgi:hypothetical protein
MKNTRAISLLMMASLVGACSEVTAPVPASEGIVVPDDGSIVVISAEIPATKGPKGLSFTTIAGATAHFGMSCTLITSSRRCTLLWIGATATTTIAIATCATSLGWSCAGAVVAVGYSWDQFYNEPDCNTCNSPFNMENSGQWSRLDKYWPEKQFDPGQ